MRERIVKRHQERYADFGPTLACEKLAEEGLVLSPDTLAALLKERGLWERRRRRQASQASGASGVLGVDGADGWEPSRLVRGTAAKCVLMVMIDDATSRTYARFYPAETTRGGVRRVRPLGEASRPAAVGVRGSALDLPGRGSSRRSRRSSGGR